MGIIVKCSSTVCAVHEVDCLNCRTFPKMNFSVVKASQWNHTSSPKLKRCVF